MAGSRVVRSIGSVDSKAEMNICHSSRGGIPMLLGSRKTSVASAHSLNGFSM